MTISCSVCCAADTAPDDFFSAVDVPSHALVGAATFAAEQAFRKCILAVISAALFLMAIGAGFTVATSNLTLHCTEHLLGNDPLMVVLYVVLRQLPGVLFRAS